MYAEPLSTGRTDLSAVQTIGDSILSPSEIHRIFACTPGAFRLIGEILYAAGMRLEELLRVRVRDVESDGWCLVVRNETGEVARRLRLPSRLRDALQDHLGRLQAWHAQEMGRGQGEVSLKGVEGQEHPLGGRRWCWQFVFPSADVQVDPSTGRTVRSHLEPARVQAQLAAAGRDAGIAKPVHAQSLRHAFAMQYLGRGRPVGDLQRLMGHTNPATTHRYIEVLQAARDRHIGRPDRSVPADRFIASPVQLDMALAS